MAALIYPVGLALDTLLQGLAMEAIPAECRVSGLALDSRKVQEGDLFLALAGTRSHGADYIAEALARGAAAVAVDAYPVVEGVETGAVPLIPIAELRANVGVIADRFFGHPSRYMWIAGITGTNGKTSVSQFIAQALSIDAPCGVIGTLVVINRIVFLAGGIAHAAYDPSARYPLKVTEVEFRRNSAGRQLMARSPPAAIRRTQSDCLPFHRFQLYLHLALQTSP